MKLLARVIEFIAGLFCRKKGAKKDVGEIPKDNYPMF